MHKKCYTDKIFDMDCMHRFMVNVVHILCYNIILRFKLGIILHHSSLIQSISAPQAHHSNLGWGGMFHSTLL